MVAGIRIPTPTPQLLELQYNATLVSPDPPVWASMSMADTGMQTPDDAAALLSYIFPIGKCLQCRTAPSHPTIQSMCSIHRLPLASRDFYADPISAFLPLRHPIPSGMRCLLRKSQDRSSQTSTLEVIPTFTQTLVLATSQPN